MEQIIFICTGNTCRSPMAEGLFRAHNGEEKTGLTVASAGLYTENGLPASANAVAAAGERGADIFGAPLAAADRRDGRKREVSGLA